MDEGIEYASRLKEAGVPIQLKIYEGMTHDFARLTNIVNDASKVREEVAQQLRGAFAAPRT